MSDTKTTYIMPDQNNDMATMAMMNGGGWNNLMWNNPFMYLIWLALFNNNGGLFGNNNAGNLLADAATLRLILTVQETLQDNHNSDLIMQGILGSAEATRLAAERMGLNYNALQMAVNNVSNAIGLVLATTGFSAERVINAVNAGNAGLSQALCLSICGVRSDITNQGYLNLLASERLTNTLQNTANQNTNALNSTLVGNSNAILMQMNNIGNTLLHEFCLLNYNLANQTCELKNVVKDTGSNAVNVIVQKLDLMLTQSLLDKIDSLQAKNAEQAVTINNGVLSALFSLMLDAKITPINTAIAVLNRDITEVLNKLPNTVTLPYSAATAVPTGLYNYYTSGNNGYWN